MIVIQTYDMMTEQFNLCIYDNIARSGVHY